VIVPATQFRLLAVLVGELGRTFTRGELVEHAIGDLVEERTVDVHIKELRRMLGLHGARIETVLRQDYRFLATPV
jgi:two-component system phosphate regulon response regulator PhoB